MFLHQSKHILHTKKLLHTLFKGSVTAFLHAVEDCESVSLSRKTLSQQPEPNRNKRIINFKFPHEVVSACAKRDEPPSRRRPANPASSRVFFFSQIPQNDGRRLRGFLFLQCIQWTIKFVLIRVDSWLIMNNLNASGQRRDAVVTSAYTSKWFFQAKSEAGRCSAWRWAGLASAAG